jgi:hypothetical protein
MVNPILSVSIKGYEPKTYGSNDVWRKKELRDLVFAKINNLPELRKQCRGKKLSFDVCFNLFSDTDVEGRKTKDLDNMLKIFCDIFPDFVDRAKTIQGLGLIEEDRDDMIFEIHCKKRLVPLASEEGIDFSIYEHVSFKD